MAHPRDESDENGGVGAHPRDENGGVWRIPGMKMTKMVVQGASQG